MWRILWRVIAIRMGENAIDTGWLEYWGAAELIEHALTIRGYHVILQRTHAGGL